MLVTAANVFGNSTLGFLILRLRPPRPSLRYLALSPGRSFIFHLCSLYVDAVITFAHMFPINDLEDAWITFGIDFVYRLSVNTGHCIVQAWLILALGRNGGSKGGSSGLVLTIGILWILILPY